MGAHLQPFTTTIFNEMSLLAARTGSINLGQGFPDVDGPPEVAEAAIAAILDGHNQYPPGPGLPALRQAVAEHQRRCYGLDHDPDTEVVVTMGATEAIVNARPETRPEILETARTQLRMMLVGALRWSSR